MTSEGRLGARRRGVPRAIYIGVLVAVLWAGAGGTALAQVPDNRDLKLDPEDSVPPFYRYTLDERDQQRLDAAREAGETFIPVLQGQSMAPGEGAPTTSATDAPTTPQPAYEGYRRPETAAPRASGREGQAAGDPRSDGLVGVLIEAWTRQPEIARVRYPAAGQAPGAVEHGNAAREADREPGAAASGLRPEGPARVSLRAEGLWPEGLPHIGAGRGLYARAMYAVDSDYPGPVLLEILEPPLAGAVASGAFTLIGERLTLRLTRLEYRGRSFGVDAWPGSTAPATRGRRGRQPLVRTRAAAGVRAFRRGLPHRPVTAARDRHRGRRAALRAPGDVDPRGGSCRARHGAAHRRRRASRERAGRAQRAHPPAIPSWWWCSPRSRALPGYPAMSESNDLGKAMISLVRDLEPGLLILVTAVCYLLALMALAQGLLRLLKTSEDKFHAPSAGGTALSFLICIVLAALPSWLDAATESLFGTANPPGTASLGYGGRGADYDALLAAVFALVALGRAVRLHPGRVRAARRSRRASRRERRARLRPHGRRHRRLAPRRRHRRASDQPRHHRAEHPLMPGIR